MIYNKFIHFHSDCKIGGPVPASKNALFEKQIIWAIEKAKSRANEATGAASSATEIAEAAVKAADTAKIKSQKIKIAMDIALSECKRMYISVNINLSKMYFNKWHQFNL